LLLVAVGAAQEMALVVMVVVALAGLELQQDLPFLLVLQ
jgi:hypothetical protein